MVGKLICWVTRKHKRGKRLQLVDGNIPQLLPNATLYECPRCHATWTRKRAKKEQA